MHVREHTSEMLSRSSRVKCWAFTREASPSWLITRCSESSHGETTMRLVLLALSAGEIRNRNTVECKRIAINFLQLVLCELYLIWTHLCAHLCALWFHIFYYFCRISEAYVYIYKILSFRTQKLSPNIAQSA